MAKNEDKTLLLDILQPFRRVVNGNSPKAAVSSAAARLNFSDTINDLLRKRKSSYISNNTPTKRSRTESDTSNCATPNIASPWEAKRMKGDLIEAKSQIAVLESRIDHQNLIRKEMEILYENEKQCLVEERKRSDKTKSEMEERLRFVRNREAEVVDQLSKAVRTMDEIKAKTERDKQVMQKQIADLKAKVIDTAVSGNGQMSEMKKDMVEITQALEASQKEIELLKAAHDAASVEAAKVSGLQISLDRQNLALHQADQKIKQLETDKESYKDWLEQAKVSQKRLAAMPALERDFARLNNENRELKAACQQKMLLEEQVHCLTSRIKSLQPVHQNLIDLQTSNVETERVLEEWKAVGLAYNTTEPRLLSGLIQRLQQVELSLTTEKLQAETKLSNTNNELITANHERDKAVTKMNDMANIQRTQQSLIHRLQKKLLLLSRERDSYRQQLDCYEKELTVSLAGDGHGRGVESLLPARVESLEKALQGYRDLLAKIEEDSNASKAEGTPALYEQLSRLSDEVQNLRKDNEILRSTKDKLELQVEKWALKGGDFPQSQTKIVHLIDNPTSKAQEEVKNELQKAHAEVIELKKKLKKLQTNELEMTQKLSESIREGSSKEVEQLRAQIESNKMRQQRMKEVYTSLTQEYRNVCYMLTGYKMDRVVANSYRLSSMYAESPDEYLSFKVSEGEIEMVRTDYSSTLDELVDLHLNQNNSFPVFLSSLTLELFQKTTVLTDNTE